MSDTSRPNLLFITSDQQRADCFGFEGRKVKTPHLDLMARQGTVFGQCITPNPVCQPTRASLLTGQLPRTHGVADNGLDLPPETGEKGFAGALSRSGYQTALLGQAPSHFSVHCIHGHVFTFTLSYIHTFIHTHTYIYIHTLHTYTFFFHFFIGLSPDNNFGSAEAGGSQSFAFTCPPFPQCPAMCIFSPFSPLCSHLPSYSSLSLSLSPPMLPSPLTLCTHFPLYSSLIPPVPTSVMLLSCLHFHLLSLLLTFMFSFRYLQFFPFSFPITFPTFPFIHPIHAFVNLIFSYPTAFLSHF